MPVVFSPGEAETRPLNPEAIVYTTADKVGELLGIAPGEPVLAAADASATGFYITGTDLREHGFESGDTILAISDLYPLGETFTIGAPVVEDVTGTKYVKLPVTLDAGAAGENDAFASYTTAANTEIQNKSVFTNGKSRGVTKDIVNTHIRRIQDRIDNWTHNAWRPYLCVAEYINFDTYKPYRRRYYTDYVGTTPLLYRNVQQMLRIELWQGDNYRELAGAEARVEVVDYAKLSGDSLYIHPGEGTTPASLTVGTASNQWRASYDVVTSAQNLADLINKEDRVNKAAIDFSGLTLETSTGTQQVSVHHEFLATANSDYGSGVLKITSMRPAGGGKTASIAASDETNLSISHTSSHTATSQHHKTVVQINFANGYAKGYALNMDTDGGDARDSISDGDTIYNAKGTVIGIVTAVGINSVRVANDGGIKVPLVDNEYIYTAKQTKAADTTKVVILSTEVDNLSKNGGLVTIANGESTRVAHYSSVVEDTTTHIIGEGADDTVTPILGVPTAVTTGVISGFTDIVNDLRLQLGGTSGAAKIGTTITQKRLNPDLGFISGTSGDKQRLKDWWLDAEMGIIYFNNSYPFFEWNAVKASYIYGERYLEKAIEEAATKLVCSELLMSDDRSVLIPEGTQNVDLGSKIQLWRKEAMEILSRYKEIVVFA